MSEDGKVRIDKFNGTDFAWWKMQIEALLAECDLEMVLEEKPAEMDKASEAIWKSKDKKAKGKITLALTRSVAFNILKETTARGMMTALSNMYEKPSAGNKVFLMRELFTMRMREGSSVTDHINDINSILSRLSSVGMKFDDDTQAVILLSSLPDSWSGFVTAVTETAGTGNLKFDRIRDSALGEDIRRKNNSGGSSSEMLHVGRGRVNNRSSGSRGKSSSRTRKSVKCWSCNEVGHVKSQCPGTKNEVNTKGLNTAEDVSDDDVLILCVENSVDSWVMDSGSSFHAMHCVDTMENLKVGNFGKVRIANGDVLDVTGMGDVNLVTHLGTTWNLKNARVVPALKRKLISVSQLDKQGLEVKFGGDKWKVIKGSLVIARGNRRGSLYMVEVPAEGSMTIPQNKVGFARSKGQKKVHFARLEPGAKVIHAERNRRSKLGQGFGDSGSTARVPGTVKKLRWVLKTRNPIVKISPEKLLLDEESGNGPRCISGSGGMCKPVETVDESVAVLVTTGRSGMTAGLELGGASIGP